MGLRMKRDGRGGEGVTVWLDRSSVSWSEDVISGRDAIILAYLRTGNYLAHFS